MISVSLSWIAHQCQGELIGDDLQIEAVGTDTRQLTQGQLFIALVGSNFNGHKFVQQAAAGGASALLVSEVVDSSLPQIRVADTQQALGLLAAAVKAKVAPKTVAITGSSGKTTVKEMVAAILSRKGKVLATKGNFNNEIGVPLTLLDLEADHKYAVVELGANHLGEIAYTTNLVKPDVATIVNASAAHLEGFGSLLGVARAKGEIFKGLGEKGVAVINADSQFCDFWLGKLTGQPLLQFSAEKAVDFYAESPLLGLDGCAEFTLHTPAGSCPVRLTLPGQHNVGNAVLAAALSMQLGATLQDVQLGLVNMGKVQGRLNVKQLTNQVRLIDDTYNANVASVQAAIDLLASFAGRKVLVLGDMAELGNKARYYHEQVGEYALQKGIDKLFTLGVLSQAASDVFDGQGAHFSQLDQLVYALNCQLEGERQDISVLVKGSRSAGMERVVAALEDSPMGKWQRVRERIAC